MAPSVSTSGTRGFGQWISSRSIASRRSLARLSFTERSRSCGASIVGCTLVVTMTSARSPDARTPSPTSRSLSYICAVSIWRYPIRMACSVRRAQSRPRKAHVPSPRIGILKPLASPVCIALLLVFAIMGRPLSRRIPFRCMWGIYDAYVGRVEFLEFGHFGVRKAKVEYVDILFQVFRVCRAWNGADPHLHQIAKRHLRGGFAVGLPDALQRVRPRGLAARDRAIRNNSHTVFLACGEHLV